MTDPRAGTRPQPRRGRVLLWLTLFGVAFGYIEAAVVVYLRRIAYPTGFQFPLAVLEPRLAATELVREVATLLLLLAVASLAARSGWGRFGAFAVGFGIWDLAYYAALKALLDWPSTWGTWDVLFLIPGIWTGPVWSAVIVAVCLVVCGAWMMVSAERGRQPRARWPHWLAASASLLVLMGAFLANHGVAAAGLVPEQFPVGWFGLGLGIGLAVFWTLFGRSDSPN